jgi:hypothetical protein
MGGRKTQNRLYAVVTAMAIDAQQRGLDRLLKRSDPPLAGTDSAKVYDQITRVVESVQGGTRFGDPLPKKAVIWELTESGVPRLDTSLPKAAGWILDSGVTFGGDFEAGIGSYKRTYRLYESAAAPADRDLALVSGSTGTGVSAAEEPKPRNKIAWALGIIGILLLIAGGAMSDSSGRVFSGARSVLSTSDPERKTELLLQIANICVDDHEKFPAAEQDERAVCKGLLGKTYERPKKDAKTGKLVWSQPDQLTSVLSTAKGCETDYKPPDCEVIWRAALALEATGKSALFGFFTDASAKLTGTSSGGGTISILVPMLAMIFGIFGLAIGLGLGTKQRVDGILIDDRNRVSLARSQVTLWTVVALGGYAALALFNVGLIGVQGAEATGASAFPGIPASIAAALGIAAASPMLSALILDGKKTPPPDRFSVAFDRAGSADLVSRGATFFGRGTTGLDARSSPAQASIADIFMGEENANSDTVDPSRLQNVVITVMLLSGYFAFLVELVRHITPDRILTSQPLIQPIFTSLPNPGATFAALLLVSHAAYLVGKAYDNKPAPSTSQAGGTN